MRADHDKVKKLLLTARGQLDGLIRMVDDDRYCIDISNQLMATGAVLRKANQEVLQAHMMACVKNAATDETDEKLAEINDLIGKLLK